MGPLMYIMVMDSLLGELDDRVATNPLAAVSRPGFTAFADDLTLYTRGSQTTQSKAVIDDLCAVVTPWADANNLRIQANLVCSTSFRSLR